MRVHRFVLVSDSTDFEDGSAEVEIELPVGAEIIGQPRLTTKGLVMYAIVDADADAFENRSFVVVGNGVDLPDGTSAVNYVGTEKIVGGPTFHVFDVTKVIA